jgi:hypothetical protein
MRTMRFTESSPGNWVRGSWMVCHPFHGDGTPVPYNSAVALGYPRGGTCFLGDIEAFKALAAWLAMRGIKCVAGPVLSGAQMAYMVAMASKGSLCASYIPKEGYRSLKHCDGLFMCSPYALVDDIVSSGESILAAADQALKETGELPAAIIADRWPCSRDSRRRIVSRFGDRLWTVRKLEGE